jgi:hypothetical protein
LGFGLKALCLVFSRDSCFGFRQAGNLFWKKDFFRFRAIFIFFKGGFSIRVSIFLEVRFIEGLIL